MIDKEGIAPFWRLIRFIGEFRIPSVVGVFFENDRNRKVVRIVMQCGFQQFVRHFTVGNAGFRKGNHAVTEVMRHIAGIAQLLLDFQCFTLRNLLQIVFGETFCSLLDCQLRTPMVTTKPSVMVMAPVSSICARVLIFSSRILWPLRLSGVSLLHHHGPFSTSSLIKALSALIF